MFQLVKDVEAYPDFLPWCKALNITAREDKEILADMVIGFKKIEERFTSRVFCDEKKLEIVVQYDKGPFKYLENRWQFKESKTGCSIFFYVKFSLKNFLLDVTLKPIFSQITRKMIYAFESRAKKIYE